MVYFLMRHYRDATADFNAYITLAPPGDAQVKEGRQAIHHIRALLN